MRVIVDLPGLNLEEAQVNELCRICPDGRSGKYYWLFVRAADGGL